MVHQFACPPGAASQGQSDEFFLYGVVKKLESYRLWRALSKWMLACDKSYRDDEQPARPLRMLKLGAPQDALAHLRYNVVIERAQRVASSRALHHGRRIRLRLALFGWFNNRHVISQRRLRAHRLAARCVALFQQWRARVRDKMWLVTCPPPRSP